MNRLAALDAAKVAVADRPNSYGNPEDNFERIAALWSTHLQNVGVRDTFAVYDVAIMLALVKIARLEADPKHADSWIDMAGYAGCGAEVSGAGEDIYKTMAEVAMERAKPAQTSDLVDDVAQHVLRSAPRAPESKFGFKVGETVNVHTDRVGHRPGEVLAFSEEGRIRVRWSNPVGEAWFSPVQLRHGV